MVPVLIGACAGLAVGAHMLGRGRGRRRRRGWFFGRGRRRRGPPYYASAYGPQHLPAPSDETMRIVRVLLRQFFVLFCRAYPNMCSRRAVLADPWARGYLARQVAVAIRGSVTDDMVEPIADYVSAKMGSLL